MKKLFFKAIVKLIHHMYMQAGIIESWTFFCELYT